MSETLNLILTKFTDEAITISTLFLSLVLALLVAYWFYNRNKLRKLSHQIPASVVKNYLDSIIQNSNSLKSSLFRGGGLDIGDGIPSVVPAGDLAAGNIGINDNSEELNKKIAEISVLRGQLGDKTQAIEDLQNQINKLQESSGGDVVDNSEEISNLESTVTDLQGQLQTAQEALANAPTTGDSGDLDEISKERDELKERLMEYEIIEEDLANLKRLQQENEQLKNSLAAAGGETSAPEAAPEAEEEIVEPSEVIAEEAAAPVVEEPVEEVIEEPATEPVEEVATKKLQLLLQIWMLLHL